MEQTSLLWNQPDWIAAAQVWIEDAVQRAGSRLTGPVEQPYIRPWSTVMRMPTSSGVYFFKASIPAFAGEMPLTLALAARSPDCMPEIIAADTRRGWMITRDAGTPLRQLLHTPEDLRLLDSILPLLAEVQMQWAGQQDELVSLGALDQRIETLPARFERLAADREALLVGQADWLNEAQYEKLLASVPRYAELCARLLESPIPQSIHYDDMHGGNVYLRGVDGRPARVTFGDWGDSCAGHPFSSLLIFLRAVSDLMGLTENSTETPEVLPPMLARLRDVYLEPWQRFAPQAMLVETFNLAWRVGMVSRALSWLHMIEQLDEPFRPEYRYTVPAWLSEFLLTM